MRKNAKGVISALIAGMMLTTSSGVVSFAEETAADTTNTVTETTEATAAPAAKDYSNDKYYNDALKVCSALGIITGYDDGSIKPESTVTRAEMAAIILRMINFSAEATYKDVFLDVKSDHWAANTIQTAVEQGIVDGMGDGTFVPDGEVKYEQVIKMIVCAMGYQIDAERAGGYPNGYISVGNTSLDLLGGVAGKVGENMTRGEVIKAVFNAMFAPYRTVTDVNNGNPVYSAKNTLGVEKFNLYEDKGILTTTPNMSATGTATREDEVVIDGVQYRCKLTDIEKYLGTTVKFYYIDSTSDMPEIIVMTTADKTNEVNVDSDMLESLTLGDGANFGELRAYASETSSSTKKYKLAKSVDVIYNGTALTRAEYSTNPKKYKDEDGREHTLSYDEYITPDVGSIRVVDYEADGYYDVLFIDSYETMLVTSATSEKVSGKINNVSTTIKIDENSGDQTVKVTKSGTEATVKNLKKNDVASIKRNFDESTIEFVVTGETITGTIVSVGTDGDNTVITVNDEEYEVDKNAESNVKNGLSAILYLDAFNRVGYIESSTGTMLSGSEKYGIVANAYQEDGGDTTVKIFSQDGEALTLKAASTVKYWGATGETKLNAEDLVEELNNNGNFVSVEGSPVKLCRYSVNSSGELSKLYMAVAEFDKNSDSDALQAYNGSLKNASRTAGMVGGYFIKDGILEFTVPSDAESVKNPANYKVGTATASTYTHYENAPNFDYTVADCMNGSYPQVIIKFESGSNVVTGSNYTSNANNPPTFMVSKVINSIDEEGDTIFQVRGYSGGAEVIYTTTKNTGVYNFSASFGDYSSSTKLVFDATKDEPSVFKEHVQPGDIFVVGASGSNAQLMIKLADADGIAKTAVTGSSYSDSDMNKGQWKGKIQRSSTRDIYYAGFVSDVNIEDLALIDIDGIDETLPFATSTSFSFAKLKVDGDGNVISVEVDENGGIDPSEVFAKEDGSTEYDYALFKMFKGSMQPGYIVRIEVVD